MSGEITASATVLLHHPCGLISGLCMPLAPMTLEWLAGYREGNHRLAQGILPRAQAVGRMNSTLQKHRWSNEFDPTETLLVE